MNNPPDYFEKIRQKAAKRWDQLEADPELAGPWHQLFKQVQSQRHVLSELLQNADDAGATEVSAGIQGEFFVFSHNGEDFTEEQFESLCRFGYSNKRVLHTIGFRGIGFKSTFSLGDRIEIFTPTLSVAFNKKRFTEPVWNPESFPHRGLTTIRIHLGKTKKRTELEKNLLEWTQGAASLLFFRKIRNLRINDREVRWITIKPGPFSGSEWIARSDDTKNPYLVFRSMAGEFPADAVEEIQQERMVSTDEETILPPPEIDIILGLPGRLYVVLPTGIQTTLPFACNAPFIQDPARLKIKDPEISPTNQWLLKRIGELTAAYMLAWLNARVEDRSWAYDLIPEKDRGDNTIEEACGRIVREAFDRQVEGKPYLLGNDDNLYPANTCISIPEEINAVWEDDYSLNRLDSARRQLFFRRTPSKLRNKLIRRGVLEELTRANIVKILQYQGLQKPETWAKIFKLWSYLSPELNKLLHDPPSDLVRILPIQGKDVLYSAKETVRLGGEKLPSSGQDLDFLNAQINVLDPEWLSFLTVQQQDVERRQDRKLAGDVRSVLALLDNLQLGRPSDPSTIIERTARGLFSAKEVGLQACIQLARIAGSLDVQVGPSFRYMTTNGVLNSPEKAILFDADGTLEALVSKEWGLEHILHPEYRVSFKSHSGEAIFKWAYSSRSGLTLFIPLVNKVTTIYGRSEIQAELQRRGSTTKPSYHYKTNCFRVNDWDFEEIHWQYWGNLSKDDPSIWSRIILYILLQVENYLSRQKMAAFVQVSTAGRELEIVSENFTPNWILKFKDLPCLPDTHGVYHKPADLVRRTPETESFQDIEPFVHSKFDTESSRPLLVALGVRDTPINPNYLLTCLRSLAKSTNPPILEVEKWYRRLDMMINTCSTSQANDIQKAFQSENIILTQDGNWTNSSAIFLSGSGELIPGTDTIRSSVRDLMLWRRIGVEEQPTAELIVRWLNNIPSGKQLTQEDIRHMQGALRRFPERIWNECGHWINLAGKWNPANEMTYSLTMQTLIPYAHLFDWIKEKTADLRFIGTDAVNSPPFLHLSSLSTVVVEEFRQKPVCTRESEIWTWSNILGEGLSRIILDHKEEEQRVRLLARDLEKTCWQAVRSLELSPSIEGKPSGTARQTDIRWSDQVLYYQEMSKARLAKRAPEEIGKVFGIPEIKAALDYCYERDPEEILAYLSENFTLLPRDSLEVSEAEQTRPQPENIQTGLKQDSRFVIGELPATTTLEVSGSIVTESTPQESELQKKEIHGDEAIAKMVSPDLDKTLIGVKMPSSVDDSNRLAKDLRRSIDFITHVPDMNSERAKRSISSSPEDIGQRKISLIHQFAISQGFQEETEGIFRHRDGRRLSKAKDSLFPWELRSKSGELLASYWSKDHCLEFEPLQLEADLWGLIELHPEQYSLILQDKQDRPMVLSGTRLVNMRQAGELKIYPAAYRLVINPTDKT